MTGEELLRRPDLEPCELVAGRVVPRKPNGLEHGVLLAEIGSELRAWAQSTGSGRVLGGGVGIYTRRDPDTVRAADVIFISARTGYQRTPGYIEVAPELVGEVLSLDDAPGVIRIKIEEYFSIGVERVWLVEPRLRQISAYRTLTQMRQYRLGDILVDEEILPGFRLALTDLFSA